MEEICKIIYKEEPSCLVCKRTEKLDNDIKQIDDEFAHSSGKALKSVLGHLLKCTNIEMDITSAVWLCSKCLHFLQDYDEQVVRLMILQKRFKVMHDNPVKVSTEEEPEPESEILSPSKICFIEENGEAIIETEDIKVEEEFLEDVSHNVEVTTDDDDMSEYEEGDENDEDDDDDDEDADIDAKSVETNRRALRNGMLVQCKYCSEYFKNQGRLRLHISEMHVKKESHCSICNISVRDEEYLELHMNLHEGKTEYDCRYCPKRFTHKSSVIRHMHKHWDKKKYQCEKCGLRFSETPRLYNHKLLHEAEENPLICHICNQVCKTRRTYKRHMNTHREDRPRYPCHICGKTFSEKFTLKPHLRTHEGYVEPSTKRNTTMTTTHTTTEITTTEIYNCIICGNDFNNREQYTKHMQNEHDVISWDT